MVPEESGSWSEYSLIYLEHTEKFVYPEDLKIWKRYMSPKGLEEFLNSGLMETTFSVRMQNTKSGLQWHEAYLEKYKDHVLIASRDIKKEQRSAAELTQKMRISNVVQQLERK